jgi:hypothetical protein
VLCYENSENLHGKPFISAIYGTGTFFWCS